MTYQGTAGCQTTGPAGESLAAATGFELPPSIDSRASCPEAIWQAARWWYGLHDQVSTRRLMGAYCVGHELLP